MNADEAFGIGAFFAAIVCIAIFFMVCGTQGAHHKKEIQFMQKAAIERGVAEWKDDDGKPVFTWKEIAK